MKMIRWVREFWGQESKRYRNFQIVFAVLTLNFAIPTMSYIFWPQVAVENFQALNELMGGEVYGFAQAELESRLWRYLGAANVATLALMCLLLQVNLRKNFAVLVPLTFMKSLAATLWLAGFVAHPHYPVFLAAAVLDYVTSAAFVYFALGAARDLDGRREADLRPVPLVVRR